MHQRGTLLRPAFGKSWDLPVSFPFPHQAQVPLCLCLPGLDVSYLARTIAFMPCGSEMELSPWNAWCFLPGGRFQEGMTVRH